jgi:hypothetical protein
MFSSIEFPICFRSLLSNGCVGHVFHGTALGIAPGIAYYDTDEGQRERATWILLDDSKNFRHPAMDIPPRDDECVVIW